MAVDHAKFYQSFVSGRTRPVAHLIAALREENLAVEKRLNAASGKSGSENMVLKTTTGTTSDA